MPYSLTPIMARGKTASTFHQGKVAEAVSRAAAFAPGAAAIKAAPHV
jgi:hypothetical protein